MSAAAREHITNGSLTRALLLLAAPLVAQNMVQVAQQVVDTFWVGQLGEDAVAAVGLNFPIMALLFALTVGIFTGTQVLVSQRVGSDDASGARRAAFHGVVLALAIGGVAGGLVFVFAPDIISLLGTKPTVASFAASYLAVFAVALPIAGASDALEAGFIGWGDSRAALYINVTAVVVNIVLDPFLILGLGPFPELEVQGAALATALGYLAGLLLALGMVMRGRDEYTITRSAMTFELDDARELVEVGLPNTGQHAASQSVRLLIVGLVSAVGGAAGLAAYTVGARIASVSFVPASGLAQAAQSVIGQNLGANKPGRARRTTWVGAAIAGGSLTVIGACQWLFPAALTMLFVPDISATGFGYTVEYLRILAYGYWAIGATYLFNAGFNGARRTSVSLVASLVQYWAVRLPIAAVGALVLDFGVQAVFWAVTLSNIAAALGAGFYYYYTTSNGMLERAADTASSAASN